MDRNIAYVKTSSDPSIHRLLELMPELMSLLHRDIAGETLAIMHESSLTMPQIVALHILNHAGALPISRMGDLLHLSTSATSHLVERLVERGLVDRSEDPADRRQKRVVLAAAGSALLDQLNASREAEYTVALHRLDPALRQSLLGLVEQMISQLRLRA